MTTYKICQEEIERNAHIPTAKVQADRAATANRVQQLEDLRKTLPQDMSATSKEMVNGIFDAKLTEARDWLNFFDALLESRGATAETPTAA